MPIGCLKAKWIHQKGITRENLKNGSEIRLVYRAMVSERFTVSAGCLCDPHNNFLNNSVPKSD